MPEWLAGVGPIDAVECMPVDDVLAVPSVTLPGDFRKDPAGRLIVATASKLGVVLVPADAAIRACPHGRTIG